MNVIVANKHADMLGTLEVDVIKSINGEFEVDDLVSLFSNFFYQRMILDITAIKNYRDAKNLQKLSISLDMDKIILVLDDSADSASSAYLSKLISMGIYNFTRNKEGIMYLYNHPNTYRDVAHIHQLDELTTSVVEKVVSNNVRILGVKNITDNAGATTLIYMLKNQLSVNYNVVCIEIDKRDFAYFNDPNMVSTTSSDLGKTLMKYQDVGIILLDLNDSNNEDACHDILYLIEPSSIKLNKLMRTNRKVFDKLKGKKIVLNKSLLDSKDVLDFEYESKSKVFYNVPPLDERKDNKNILNGLLSKLGFMKQKTSSQTEEKNKIFGLFKF